MPVSVVAVNFLDSAMPGHSSSENYEIRLSYGARTLLSGAYFRALWGAPSCQELRIYVPTFQFLYYRFFIELGAFFVRAKKRWLVDLHGQRLALSRGRLAAGLFWMLVDIVTFPLVVFFSYIVLLVLELCKGRRVRVRSGEPDGGIGYLFLPFDFAWEGVVGGAGAHMRGVLEGLRDRGMKASVISSQQREDFPSGVDAVTTVLPWRWGEHILNVPVILYNARVFRKTWKLFRKRRPSLVYQRHLLFNISGLLLARVLRRPFILEYNGSEIWVVKHWGPGWMFLMHLARWMERVNIRSAELLVVVSERVREELLTRGVPSERILINPNGANFREFRPEIDGSAVRDRYGISRNTVVAGFIGTFGFWHGVEVLAKAVRRAAEAVPNLHFLFIGDGPLLNSVKEQIASDGCEARVTFTGRVPSEEAPAHLAACDILLSPHVQNPDGSPFFGSPTKLFEYLAMGRAVVASGIEQLAQVLEHERTALLVPPGDPEVLARSIVRLARDKELRLRLGSSARDHVVKHYTWDKHVARILDRVRNMGLVA